MKLFSRKLWMTVFAAALALANFWWLIDYLYSFAEYARPDRGYEPGTAQMLVTAFVSIAKDHAVLFGSIILAYLGVAGVIQWKHGTESITEIANVLQTQRIDETVRNENLREYQE